MFHFATSLLLHDVSLQLHCAGHGAGQAELLADVGLVAAVRPCQGGERRSKQAHP